MDSINSDHYVKTQLESACTNLRSLLRTSAELNSSLSKTDTRFITIQQSLIPLSKTVAPIQSLAIARKALETRLNRAISPALALLQSFKLFESLQVQLLQLTSNLQNKNSKKKRLNILLKYVKCTDQLTDAIGVIVQKGEAAIQKMQEVVEFLSRTKATDQYRTHRLMDTLMTLKVLFETEIDVMKFDGLLDKALMILQDEFEGLLDELRHPKDGEMEEMYELGNDDEIEAMRSIVETLADNDCLDICIDIFVKTRYRRAAKALTNLNPHYLKTYTSEEIDDMKWAILENAIAQWIDHFNVAVTKILVAEKTLCDRILSSTIGIPTCSECFIKISDKIMAIFFRFGEGVTRSNKDPQKLFKLLDMFELLQKLKREFSDIFDGDAGEDICTRYREFEKLLIHASSKVFWEFGLQIEGNVDGLNPPYDGSVSKTVRYAVNYLKYLTTDTYLESMKKVLQTEQMWKKGILSKPDSDQDIFKNAICNVLNALQRSTEIKRTRYRDNVLPHIFAMNNYWYIYMKTRNTEIGKILGDQWMKKTFKVAAEESAYMYQKEAWGPLVEILENEDMKKGSKIETFMKMFKDLSQAHKTLYNITDFDLKAQISEATVKFIVPVYAKFVDLNFVVVKGKSYLSPEAMQEAVSQVFETDRRLMSRNGVRQGGVGEGNNGVSGEGFSHMKAVRRFKSNVSDV